MAGGALGSRELGGRGSCALPLGHHQAAAAGLWRDGLFGAAEGLRSVDRGSFWVLRKRLMAERGLRGVYQGLIGWGTSLLSPVKITELTLDHTIWRLYRAYAESWLHLPYTATYDAYL